MEDNLRNYDKRDTALQELTNKFLDDFINLRNNETIGITI